MFKNLGRRGKSCSPQFALFLGFCSVNQAKPSIWWQISWTKVIFLAFYYFKKQNIQLLKVKLAAGWSVFITTILVGNLPLKLHMWNGIRERMKQSNALCMPAFTHKQQRRKQTDVDVCRSSIAQVIDLSWDILPPGCCYSSPKKTFFEAVSSMCPTGTDEVSCWHFNGRSHKLPH